MAHDESMAARVRDALPAGATERRMFGGLSFLVDGHLTIAVGSDDLMVRVGRDATDDVLDLPGARPCVMGERTMKDWVLVDLSAVADDQALAAWTDRGLGFVRTLPAR